jgi:hypothetical protein
VHSTRHAWCISVSTVLVPPAFLLCRSVVVLRVVVETHYSEKRQFRGIRGKGTLHSPWFLVAAFGLLHSVTLVLPL